MIEEPKCFTRDCKYFKGIKEIGGEGEKFERPVCDAFPKGIPKDITFGQNLHLKPVLGDHGIQFEKSE